MRANVMLIAFLGLAMLPCAGQSSGASSKAGSSTLDKFDFGLTFTEKYAKITNTTGTYFNLPGGSFDAAYSLDNKVKRLSIAVDVQGEAATHDITLGVGLTQFSYVAGPRYTFWKQKSTGPKANMYIEALAGGMHAWDSLFITPTKTTTSANSFALQTGGGLNLPLAKKWGWRVVEVDYIMTKLPNYYDNYQGDIRVSTGLNFHFHR
ncbi:MAG: hypothetical protein ABSC47_01245 [Terracidiphilus sp.]|jgi:hypothetical protein